MISSFIVDRIKYTVEIMDYMDKNLTLKYKHLIKGIEQHLLFLQRNVERYMKTSTGWTPMFYFERRKLTEVITEIINSPERINSICRKYRYSNKKELNRKCKNYLKFTLNRMPIYVLPELKYNNIRDEFKDGKFGKRGFLLRIAVLDKSIRENTNSIKFDERETEIINYCFMMYRLLEPVNIDGICFFGINKRITYRYLKKIGVSNRFVLTKTDIVQQIKVRYLGNSGAINLDNGDKLGYHFFTKNLELDLTQCSVDFSIDLKESEVKNIIDRVYDKYKDQCIDFNSINESELNDEFIKELNGKMKNFRYGEIITVSIFKNTVVAINDFYPKVKIITGKEILHLIKNLIDKMENNNKSVKFDENVMVSGYEVINKIIRFSLTQPEKSISQFVDLPYLYIEYINNKLSKDEMVCEYNKIFKEMYQYIDIIKELYNKISEY